MVAAICAVAGAFVGLMLVGFIVGGFMRGVGQYERDLRRESHDE